MVKTRRSLADVLKDGGGFPEARLEDIARKLKDAAGRGPALDFEDDPRFGGPRKTPGESGPGQEDSRTGPAGPGRPCVHPAPCARPAAASEAPAGDQPRDSAGSESRAVPVLASCLDRLTAFMERAQDQDRGQDRRFEALEAQMAGMMRASATLLNQLAALAERCPGTPQDRAGPVPPPLAEPAREETVQSPAPPAPPDAPPPAASAPPQTPSAAGSPRDKAAGLVKGLLAKGLSYMQIAMFFTQRGIPPLPGRTTWTDEDCRELAD